MTARGSIDAVVLVTIGQSNCQLAGTGSSDFQDVPGLGQGAFFHVQTAVSVRSYDLSMLVNHRSVQMLFGPPATETRTTAEILTQMKTLATTVAGRL